MMKAIKNFMNKPITWGDSFKLGLGGLGLYIAIWKAIEFYANWKDIKEKARRYDWHVACHGTEDEEI